MFTLPDDSVMEGEVRYGKQYRETDFNKIIEIREREKKRVEIFMAQIDQREKSLVFCATQDHAKRVLRVERRVAGRVRKPQNIRMRDIRPPGEHQPLLALHENGFTRRQRSKVCPGHGSRAAPARALR